MSKELATIERKPQGLVIRWFSGGFFLCDGKPLPGHENDGELWVGNAVNWFKTFEEAEAMRQLIDEAYGFERKEEVSA